MGLFGLVRRQLYRGSVQRPWEAEGVAEIVGITPKGGDLALLE
jgi:hypothetical protein